jgi:hypothetical protein
MNKMVARDKNRKTFKRHLLNSLVDFDETREMILG